MVEKLRLFFVSIKTSVFIFLKPSNIVPCQDNKPFGTQMNVSLDFEEEQTRQGRQGNFKICITYHSRCCHMAGILPKRHKNPKQSINLKVDTHKLFFKRTDKLIYSKNKHTRVFKSFNFSEKLNNIRSDVVPTV